mmetsp:Transcript_24003/g.66759  ORF Transcript_24003/g.66759 Transcript_24003/m.66759 type:complete len:298 (+) Transcript_24003:410-1303(+)
MVELAGICLQLPPQDLLRVVQLFVLTCRLGLFGSLLPVELGLFGQPQLKDLQFELSGPLLFKPFLLTRVVLLEKLFEATPQFLVLACQACALLRLLLHGLFDISDGVRKLVRKLLAPLTFHRLHTPSLFDERVGLSLELLAQRLKLPLDSKHSVQLRLVSITVRLRFADFALSRQRILHGFFCLLVFRAKTLPQTFHLLGVGDIGAIQQLLHLFQLCLRDSPSLALVRTLSLFVLLRGVLFKLPDLFLYKIGQVLRKLRSSSGGSAARLGMVVFSPWHPLPMPWRPPALARERGYRA